MKSSALGLLASGLGERGILCGQSMVNGRKNKQYEIFLWRYGKWVNNINNERLQTWKGSLEP